MIMSDRVHLTQAGAQMIARRLTVEPAFYWMHAQSVQGTSSGL
jgi:hypothetical protein